MVGQTAVFTCTASGGTPMAYQWYFNGSALPAGTNSMLTVIGSTNTEIVQNPDGSFSRKITLVPGSISKSATQTSVDVQKRDGIVRILAEPNIMAISGQEGSFLAGGRILVPVPQSIGGVAIGNTITLEEKEFGVAQMRTAADHRSHQPRSRARVRSFA